ncbi:MAG: PQQ-binding-like beta-propeller repeat protein, partial [Planctomycetota bacterium]
ERGQRHGLTLHLTTAGESWAPGWGAAPEYNKARHVADASALQLQGDTLTGSVTVRLQPDAWVPADGRARTVVYALTVTLEDGELNGTYTATGDLGGYAGDVNGTIAALTLDGPPETGPAADLQPAALAHQAAVAYRQARAAVLCLRHFPQSYAAMLTSAGPAAPRWQPGQEAEMAAHLQRLRELLETAHERLAEQVQPVVDTIPIADPWFGPSEDRPLALDGEMVMLDEAVGGEGPQTWRFVPRWSLLAAVPSDPHRELDAPFLPEAVPAPAAVYEPQRDALGADYAPPGGGAMSWVERRVAFMPVAPPGQEYHPPTGTQHGKQTGDLGVHGLESARWYAATTIHSPRAVELHAAILANDYGKLWVNGRLVWVSGRQIKPHALIRIPLRQGANRLLISCQNVGQNSAIGLSLCVRGAPRAPAESAALPARTQQHTAALPPIGCRGRLGDWTSRYPEADPPLAWNINSGVNVRWRTALPDYSAANPVIWGERVFVNCEPHTLYCLDRATGAIRWQRDVHVFDFVADEQRAEAMDAWQRGWQVNEDPELEAIKQQIATAKRSLGTEEQSVAISEDERTQIEMEIRKLERSHKKLKHTKARDYQRWCERLGVGDPGWKNNYGWTMGAPITDGEHVWVKYATGVAACFTVHGERVWQAHTRLSGGVGNISSPLLLGGNFIILGKFTDRRERGDGEPGGWPPYYEHHMIAYDALTGELAWEHPVWVSGGYGGPTGMVPLRLANGTQQRELILTGSGLLFDPVDGRLVSHVRGVGSSNWSGDPVVFGNHAVFRRGNRGQVVAFALESDGTVVYRHLFDSAPALPGQAGAVYHNGRIYSNGPKGHGSHPVPWHQMGCIDAETGAKVATIWPVLREGGLGYTPPAAAGDFAVFTGTGPGPHSWDIGPTKSAEIGFVRDGAAPYLMSTCTVQDEAMVAAPVFVGECMFLRTYRSALCIAVEGKEGRDLVATHRARTILADLPQEPERPTVAAPTPITDWTPPETVPLEQMKTQSAPQAWLFAGPLPPGEDDPLAALGEPGMLRITPGTTITSSGEEYRFEPVPEEHVAASKGFSLDMYERQVYRARSTLSLLDALGGEAPSRSYFYAVLCTEAERHVQVYLDKGAGQECWFGDVQVENGDILRLAPGLYPVMLKVSLGRLPPFARKLALRLFFVDVTAPDAAYRNWLAKLRAVRPRLEQVGAELESGRVRFTIKRLLDTLDQAEQEQPEEVAE